MNSGGGGVSQTWQQVQEQSNNVQLWNYYQTSYKPFIDKYIANTENAATSGTEQAKVAGQVNAEAMKVASAHTGQPGQPNAVGTTRQLTTAAAVDAGAQVSAEGKIRQRELGQQQNIVDIGRGQQTSVQQGMEAIAGQSVRTAISDKEAELKTQGSIESAIGSAAGAAAGAYGRNLNKPAGGNYDDPSKVTWSQDDWNTWNNA